jgi:YcxB-like protein
LQVGHRASDRVHAEESLAVMQIRHQCTLQDYMEAKRALSAPMVYRSFFAAAGLLLVYFGYQLFALRDPGVSACCYSFQSGQLFGSWPDRCISKGIFVSILTFPFYETAINEDGMDSKNDSGHGTVQWTAFQSFREARNIFLLYLGARVFQVIPKRAFTDDQLREFQELIRRNLPPK